MENFCRCFPKQSYLFTFLLSNRVYIAKLSSIITWSALFWPATEFSSIISKVSWSEFSATATEFFSTISRVSWSVKVKLISWCWIKYDQVLIKYQMIVLKWDFSCTWLACSKRRLILNAPWNPVSGKMKIAPWIAFSLFLYDGLLRQKGEVWNFTK